MSEITSSSESPAEGANVEELRKQIRALTNECNGLKQVLPRLQNKQGSDMTDEIIKLGNELSHYRSMSEQWENNFAKSDQEHVRFKRKVLAELQAKEEKITEMTGRAEALERENRDLKKKVEDDESKIFKLQKQAGGEIHGVENSMVSMDESGDFLGTLSKTVESRPMERSLNDLEYVIGQMMGVLAQLDVDQYEADDLRKKIVTFLRKNGHHVNLGNVITLAKEFDDKLKLDREGIRDTNQELASNYPDNSELRHNARDLSQDSEVSRNDTRDSTRFTRTKSKSFDNTLMNRMQVLRVVCGNLFEKLQGTAQFLQSILDNLGDSDEARALIKKISEIHLDLNKSMGEAQQLADEIQHEMSHPEISIELDDTSDEDVFDARTNGRVAELEQELEKLRAIEKQYEAVKSALNNELVVKENLKAKLDEFEQVVGELRTEQVTREDLAGQVQKLEQKLGAEEGEKAAIRERLEELEAEFGAKEEELKEKCAEKASLEEEMGKYQSLVDDRERALLDADKQNENMAKKIRELEAYLGEKNAELIDIEREMDVLRNQLTVKEKEVEEMNKCAKESSAMIRENNKKLYDRIVSGTGHELEEIYKTLTSAASSSKVVSQSHSHKKNRSLSRGH